MSTNPIVAQTPKTRKALKPPVLAEATVPVAGLEKLRRRLMRKSRKALAEQREAEYAYRRGVLWGMHDAMEAAAADLSAIIDEATR